MAYVLTQLDGDDTLIEKTRFENIPTLSEFSDIAYYVDRADHKAVYKEIINSIGEWVYARACNEDGDLCDYYVDDGVYFILEENRHEFMVL